jgi:hypothetical protein
LHQLKLEEPSHHQTQVGMIIKLNHAAHKDSLKSATTVFNVLHQTFSIQLIKDADHAQLITYITIQPENAIVKFHVLHQDNLALTTFANAQLIKKEPEESSIKVQTLVNAH